MGRRSSEQLVGSNSILLAPFLAAGFEARNFGALKWKILLEYEDEALEKEIPNLENMKSVLSPHFWAYLPFIVSEIGQKKTWAKQLQASQTSPLTWVKPNLVSTLSFFIQKNGPFEQSNLRLKVMGRDVFFGPLNKPQLHADEDLVFFF